GHPAEKVVVRHPLRREYPQCRQHAQPRRRNVFRSEATTIGLKDVQDEHGEVDDVVIGHAVDVRSEATDAYTPVPLLSVGYLLCHSYCREVPSQRPLSDAL